MCSPAHGPLPAHFSYVTLSRATSLDSLVLLRPFPIRLIQQPPHEDIQLELKRLNLLEETTLANYYQFRQ